LSWISMEHIWLWRRNDCAIRTDNSNDHVYQKTDEELNILREYPSLTPWLTDLLECRFLSIAQPRRICRRVSLVCSVSLRKPFVHFHGNAFIIDLISEKCNKNSQSNYFLFSAIRETYREKKTYLKLHNVSLLEVC